jgi:hypothetical protein
MIVHLQKRCLLGGAISATDVGDEPGNLPLLEFVLKELWDKRVVAFF